MQQIILISFFYSRAQNNIYTFAITSSNRVVIIVVVTINHFYSALIDHFFFQRSLLSLLDVLRYCRLATFELCLTFVLFL